MKNHFVKILIITGILLVNACGVKPGRIDPPKTVQNDSFPKQYPSK